MRYPDFSFEDNTDIEFFSSAGEVETLCNQALGEKIAQRASCFYTIATLALLVEIRVYIPRVDSR